MATVNANPYNVMGFISRTVASNNLTVAIKDQAGANFSASNPMVHKIGSAPRSLTGALSVTVNAGANYFNAGAAELKTQEVDFFVYLGWRAASSTVFILISRIPYGKTYADFSAVAANEKYAAYSGSAPASTDEVVNIGRFNATNSGSASYNWSVPATSIVINHPIFETRVLTYAPQWTAAGVAPVLNNGTLTGKYQIKNMYVRFRVYQAMGNTTTFGTNQYYWSVPFTFANTGTYQEIGVAAILDSGTTNYYGFWYVATATTISVLRDNTANPASNTVPMTWATNDLLSIKGAYEI